MQHRAYRDRKCGPFSNEAPMAVTRDSPGPRYRCAPRCRSSRPHPAIDRSIPVASANACSDEPWSRPLQGSSRFDQAGRVSLSTQRMDSMAPDRFVIRSTRADVPRRSGAVSTFLPNCCDLSNPSVSLPIFHALGLATTGGARTLSWSFPEPMSRCPELFAHRAVENTRVDHVAARSVKVNKRKTMRCRPLVLGSPSCGVLRKRPVLPCGRPELRFARYPNRQQRRQERGPASPRRGRGPHQR